MKDLVVNIPAKNKNLRANSISVDPSIHPSTFENAVSETKFGKFNLLLIVTIFPAFLCNGFQSTTMSYVFAAAQCDLNLSLNDKGLLNSITMAGMTTGALIWGYLFDAKGRRKLISIGFFVESVIGIFCSFSQNITFLLVFKFFAGLFNVGPCAAIQVYASEFHSSNYRPRIQLLLGSINNFAFIVIPALAWLILPQNINYSFLDNKISKFYRNVKWIHRMFRKMWAILCKHIHSWNFFMLICALPPLVSGIVFTFLPESPRFLMTSGKNEEALRIFRKIYTYNTGKPEHTYPVKLLIEEKSNENIANKNDIVKTRKTDMIRKGIQQIKPLFLKPYLSKITLICSVFGCTAMSMSMLRLWLPQIYQAVNDYEYLNNGTTDSLCNMMETIMLPTNNSIQECLPFESRNNDSVYINSIINGVFGMFSLFLAGILINYVGKKTILVVFGVVSGVCAVSLYFSQSSIATVILSSLFLSLGGVLFQVLISVCVDLFPTTLRTLTISMCSMSARLWSFSGNLVFPLLIQGGCGPTFFVVGGLFIVGSLITIMLPNTDQKAMQ